MTCARQSQSTSLLLHLAVNVYWRARQQAHAKGRHMSQVVHASLHYGAQHGGEDSRLCWRTPALVCVRKTLMW